jgi:hypothetical protein
MSNPRPLALQSNVLLSGRELLQLKQLGQYSDDVYVAGCFGLAVDTSNGGVFYTDEKTDSIYRIALEGSPVKILSANFPFDVKLYLPLQ